MRWDIILDFVFNRLFYYLLLYPLSHYTHMSDDYLSKMSCRYFVKALMSILQYCCNIHVEVFGQKYSDIWFSLLVSYWYDSYCPQCGPSLLGKGLWNQLFNNLQVQCQHALWLRLCLNIRTSFISEVPTLKLCPEMNKKQDETIEDCTKLW